MAIKSSSYSSTNKHSFMHPLKDYSVKSLCTFTHKNLEFIIFIILSLALVIYIAYCAKENFEAADLPHGINQMDSIIYINLENRKDRKDLLFKELEVLDTDMTKVHKVCGIYIPKNGHRGCVQAHILALELAQLNKWDPVLILEDDAQLSVSPEDFNSSLHIALKQLNSENLDWNVLMLGSANKIYNTTTPSFTFSIDSIPLENIEQTTEQTTNTLEQITLNLKSKSKPKQITVKQLKSATTSSAYIVRLNYIDTILTLFKNCNANMLSNKLSGDGFEYQALDQQWASLQGTDKWYAFDEDLIKQRAIWSTIQSPHNHHITTT